VPLTILAALSLAIWVYLLAFRGRFWRMRADAPVHILSGEAPAVHAVVPARNEAPVVGRAMASLAAQSYPGELMVTLVDDQARAFNTID
jgi:predicted sugar kinase